MLKSTTGKATEHEEYVASTLSWDNARRSRSSGAALHDPIDVTADSVVVEAEYTENKSYSLKLDLWKEVQEKAYNGKIPAIAIRFRDPYNGKHVDLAVVDLHDLSALMEAHGQQEATP